MVEESTTDQSVERAVTHARNAAHVVTGLMDAVAGTTVGNRPVQSETALEEIDSQARWTRQRLEEALDDEVPIRRHPPRSHAKSEPTPGARPTTTPASWLG